MFKVITLNSFPGSPIPYVLNGTRSLYHDKDRLIHQISAIEEEDADIVLIQELNCHASRELMATYFKDRYHMIYGQQINRFGWWINECIQFSVALMIWWLCTLGTSDMLVAMWWLIKWMWYRTTLDVFLSGDETGLTTMIRSSRWKVLSTSLDTFHCQHGDFMNWFNPRGWQSIYLVSIHTPSLDLHVVNTHMNALGPSCFRELQALELVKRYQHLDHVIIGGDFNDTPERSTVQHLLDRGWKDSMYGISPRATWTSRNPLSRGWMRVTDRCTDFILHTNDLLLDHASLCMDKSPFVSDHMGVRATLSYRN
jgi:endonuclease/exonuclease/phosphatase family metal-dependent hydrolase